MKIGLAGWGVETISAYHFFGNDHEYVICNEEPRDDYPTGPNISLHFIDTPRTPGLVGNVTNLSYFDPLLECEKIVIVTPARKNLEKHFGLDNPIWDKVTDAERIFFEQSPTKNIIGVTGTKGKGTTSTLIFNMLKEEGKHVLLGGNIGKTPLDFMRELTKDSWVVLELSSFQLYKFPYSPHIAVHLMMMPEHIEEWHKTMDDYVESKRNIFAHQNENDFAIFYPKNEYSVRNVTFSKGTHIPYTETPGAYVDENGFLCIGPECIVHKSEFKLLGEHNVQNICAAVSAVWQTRVSVESVKKVVTSFAGLEHRLELAGEVNSVKYYDDSFGTTPDTAIVAMDAFSQQKVVIVGGHEKGNSMEKLAKRLAGDDILFAICIGLIGKKIYDLAISAGMSPDKLCVREDGNSWTMKEIIDLARSRAEAGDIVLLSTGSSSFGIFKDYKDRGNQFKQVVKQLIL